MSNKTVFLTRYPIPSRPKDSMCHKISFFRSVSTFRWMLFHVWADAAQTLLLKAVCNKESMLEGCLQCSEPKFVGKLTFGNQTKHNSKKTGFAGWRLTSIYNHVPGTIFDPIHIMLCNHAHSILPCSHAQSMLSSHGTTSTLSWNHITSILLYVLA